MLGGTFTVVGNGEPDTYAIVGAGTATECKVPSLAVDTTLDGEEFEVGSVVARRRQQGQLMYLVRWWPAAESDRVPGAVRETWEPVAGPPPPELAPEPGHSLAPLQQPELLGTDEDFRALLTTGVGEEDDTPPRRALVLFTAGWSMHTAAMQQAFREAAAAPRTPYQL